jgi:ABC-2 type transport system permease protein
MRILRVASKTLVELWREPSHLALMLFFPVLLVLFYYVAFGQAAEGGLGTYLPILVLDRDAGGTGAGLVAAMRDLEFEGKPVLDVDLVSSEAAARSSLLERKAALLLIVPPDFGQALAAARAGAPRASPAVLQVVGDPGSDSFVFARSFLTGLLREFTSQAAGYPAEELPLVYEFLPGTGTMSDFDFGVPGTIVFGIAFAVITTPIALVRENVAGTLRRLRLTRLRAGELLGGVALAQMAVVALQVPIAFASALILGFRSHGSLWLAAGICALLGLAAVGVGLLIACFSRTEGDAVNLALGALVPLVFLSGAVFPLPAVSLGTIAGHDVQVYDLLPTAHGAEALRRVLVFGDGAGALAYELAALATLSIALLAAGIVLYSRLRMRKG